MAQIVILHAHIDRAEASIIARKLKDLHFGVEQIQFGPATRGKPHETKVGAAECVVLLWSDQSKGLSELTTLAMKASGRLAQILLGSLEPDSPFDQEPTNSICSLSGWGRNGLHDGWAKFLSKVGSLTKRPMIAEYNRIDLANDPGGHDNWADWAKENPTDPLAWRAVTKGYHKAIEPIAQRFKTIENSILAAAKNASARIRVRKDLAERPPLSSSERIRRAVPWIVCLAIFLLGAASTYSVWEQGRINVTKVEATLRDIPKTNAQLSPIDRKPLRAINDQAELQDGDIIRDCDGCPELVVVTLHGDDLNTKRRYAVQRFETTVLDYELCTRSPGGCVSRRQTGGVFDGQRQPIVEVSFSDASAYANWLRKVSKRPYELPSAEIWDAIAGAGFAEDFPWSKDVSSVCDYANVDDRTARPGQSQFDCTDVAEKLTSVGRLLPDGNGIYDLFGNVAEWTSTCVRTDRGVEDCSQRVLKGGSWRSGPDTFAASVVSQQAGSLRTQTVGFRVLRPI